MNSQSFNLNQVALFSELTPQQIELLQSISHVRKYQPGEFAFHFGDIPRSLYVLIKGTVKVFMSDATGKEVVLHYFKPINLVGEYANLTDKPFPASCVFETEGIMLLIDYPLFKEKILTLPDVSIRMLASLTTKIKHLENILNRGLLMDASTRIVSVLLDDPDIFSSLKHRQIAALLNLTPETLSRVLRKLKDIGALDPDSSLIKVINPSILRDFLSQENE